MDLEQLKSQLPAFAKDIKLNLDSVLTEEGAPDLTQKQIIGVALSSAYATQNTQIVDALHAECASLLNEADLAAIKAAVTIMGMNNIYYRFSHMMAEPSYQSMHPRLRMNILANPGVEKVEFELYCLAVSIINGCEYCIQAHAKVLNKSGFSETAIHSAARICAVIHGLAAALACSS